MPRQGYQASLDGRWDQMCVPGCIEHVRATLSRRSLFGATAAATAAGTLTPSIAAAKLFPHFARSRTSRRRFRRISDLLRHAGHRLKPLKEIKKDGFNHEGVDRGHAGTHIDAPIHFSEDGQRPDAIPVEQLVVPLAVIDVADKAAADPDYQLTPADIKAWERRHGTCPRGSCVAMHAGWDRHVGAAISARTTGAASTFRAFIPRRRELLMKQRSVVGIAVDSCRSTMGRRRTSRRTMRGCRRDAGVWKALPISAACRLGAQRSWSARPR